MNDRSVPNATVPTPALRTRWRGVTFALAAACVGWLSLWSALRVQATTDALSYPSAFAPCNTTLQTCVNAVPAGDSLLILPGAYAIPELTIPRAMTIIGSGAVLRAAGVHRVVNIAAGQGTVTLIGLTIRNGSGAANGGGILIGNDTPVQLVNVIVRDNQSSGDGGGIYAGTGGNLQLIGANLINNRAPGGSGGGLRSLANRPIVVAATAIVNNTALSHGAGMHVDGSLIIATSQIAGNTSSGGAHGGGVYATIGATISGTTVISNVAGGDGGGLYATAGLAITNSQVSRNLALDDGGGIYAASVALANTTVATNTAADSGGGVVSIGPLNVAGGAIAGNTADFIGGGLRASNAATLTDVIVRDNRSATADGGGIRVDGRLVMSGGEVRGNQAFSFGGGMSLLAGAEVSGTQILSNSAGAGGGVAVFGGLTVDAGVPFTGTNLRVTGNAALLGDGGGIFTDDFVTVTLQGAPGTLDFQVSGNRADGSGGGVYVDGPAVVANCLFAGNEATFGGGLFVNGDVTVTGCLIDGNTAVTDGGGVFGNGDLTTIASSTVRFNAAARSAGGVWAENAAQVSNAAFIVNQAGATGGGLHSNGGNSLVAAATFTGNSVADLVVDGDAQGGGAIYQSGGSLMLQDVTLSNNQAQSNGGAIAARATVTIAGGSIFANAAASSGGGLYQESFGPASLTVTGTAWTENRASSGGAIYTYAPLVITDADFVSNTAKTYGGGLFSNALSVLAGGRFIANTTAITVPGVLLGGGAVYADSGSLVVSGTAFIDNVAAQQGGALLMTDNAAVSFAITGATFTGNRAFSGGAVEGSGSITVAGSTLSQNHAEVEGGAVAARGTLTVTNSAFYTNSAGSRGGAIFAASTLDTTANFTGPAIVASSFAGNTVIDGDGGAIYAEGPLSIAGSQFMHNAATGSTSPQGGAVHHRSGTLAGLLTAADNVYVQNYAAQDGGAVFTQGGAFSSEVVVNNRSGREGGGMVLQGSTTISHSLFAGNVGNLSGALRATGQSSNTFTLTVINSLFHNNGFRQTNTFAVGAEMKVFDASLTLINNTFADPQLPPGAIFRHGVQVFRSAVRAHNNIFVNYPTHSLGHGDPAPVVSILVEDHNLFFAAPLGNFGANLIAGGNSLTADPRFVDAAAGNYRLRGDSPAIDAGLDSVLPPTLAVDLDGQPRRFDGPPVTANLVDIGAYESRKVGPTAVPGGPYAGFEGSPVALDATGSSGDPPLTFAWDCTDDGAVDQTLAAPTGASCLYPDNGSFGVRLVMTDGESISVTAHTTATIANVAPAVSAPGSQTGQAGVAGQFGLGSFIDPGADAPWTVTVNWGDDTPATQFTQVSAGPLATQTYTYAVPGVYTVTVTVADKDNASGGAAFQVDVGGAGPAPQAGGPYNGVEGSPIALDATGSTGRGDLTFAWDCTDDGVDDVTLSTPTGAACTYPDDGTFSLRLTVTDVDGSAAAEAQVTVANVAPVVSAPDSQAVQAAVAGQFGLGSFIDPGADAPWTVTVNWGDDTPATQFTQVSAGPLTAQAHTFDLPGVYTVTVTVTDKDNASGGAGHSVLVASAGETVYLPLISR